MRSGVCCLIIVVFTVCAPVMAYDWATNPGNGSQGNPYQISTPEQLMAIGSNSDLLPVATIRRNE